MYPLIGESILLKKLLFALQLIMLSALVSACSAADQGQQQEASSPAGPTAGSGAPTVESAPAPARPMMGPGSGMMARHRAQIPDEYAGLTNPVSADEDSLLRGRAIYEQYCVACHGEGGMGDGPAGQQLDPQPAPIAHTSRMLGDDYLFWRISEGGAHEPFSSAMPRWQDVLDDADRWDVINYVRALGSGQELPGGGPGAGAIFDPAAEALRHEQMAADGVDQGVISQDEADAYTAVHAELDQLINAETAVGMSGSMDTRQQALLEELVAAGTITQEEADLFNSAHDKLIDAGLME
jgi:mono/diheme cytochrome c family protein